MIGRRFGALIGNMQGALAISETFNGSRGGPGKENRQNQGCQERTDSNPELAVSLPNFLHKVLAPKGMAATFSTLCLDILMVRGVKSKEGHCGGRLLFHQAFSAAEVSGKRILREGVLGATALILSI